MLIWCEFGAPCWWWQDSAQPILILAAQGDATGAFLKFVNGAVARAKDINDIPDKMWCRLFVVVYSTATHQLAAGSATRAFVVPIGEH